MGCDQDAVQHQHAVQHAVPEGSDNESDSESEDDKDSEEDEDEDSGDGLHTDLTKQRAVDDEAHAEAAGSLSKGRPEVHQHLLECKRVTAFLDSPCIRCSEPAAIRCEDCARPFCTVCDDLVHRERPVHLRWSVTRTPSEAVPLAPKETVVRVASGATRRARCHVNQGCAMPFTVRLSGRGTARRMGYATSSCWSLQVHGVCDTARCVCALFFLVFCLH